MNNKTNIEKDIIILKDKDILWNYPEARVLKAIENILTDRERLIEENKIQRIQINSAFDNGFIHKDEIKELQAKANAYDILAKKIKYKHTKANNILQNIGEYFRNAPKNLNNMYPLDPEQYQEIKEYIKKLETKQQEKI